MSAIEAGELGLRRGVRPRARGRSTQPGAAGVDLGAATPVGTGAGAALRMLAARHRRPGTSWRSAPGRAPPGCGCSPGCPRTACSRRSTSSAEHQRAAREAYAAAGIAHQRTRVITGPALEVLPRMSDGAYDMVLVDADKAGYPAYVDHALRLLRPGGLLALDNMLWHDRVADPAVRDETTSTPARPRQGAARRPRPRDRPAPGGRRPARRRPSLSRGSGIASAPRWSPSAPGRGGSLRGPRRWRRPRSPRRRPGRPDDGAAGRVAAPASKSARNRARSWAESKT